MQEVAEKLNNFFEKDAAIKRKIVKNNARGKIEKITKIGRISYTT